MKTELVTELKHLAQNSDIHSKCGTRTNFSTATFVGAQGSLHWYAAGLVSFGTGAHWYLPRFLHQWKKSRLQVNPLDSVVSQGYCHCNVRFRPCSISNTSQPKLQKSERPIKIEDFLVSGALVCNRTQPQSILSSSSLMQLSTLSMFCLSCPSVNKNVRRSKGSSNQGGLSYFELWIVTTLVFKCDLYFFFLEQRRQHIAWRKFSLRNGKIRNKIAGFPETKHNFEFAPRHLHVLQDKKIQTHNNHSQQCVDITF